jgi:hypothetical protein
VFANSSQANRLAFAARHRLAASKYPKRVAGADALLSLDSVWSDIRYAGRQLSKNPGFAGTAILVLALGLSASVAIFAFVDAALLKPLPYLKPPHLVALFESTPSTTEVPSLVSGLPRL